MINDRFFFAEFKIDNIVTDGGDRSRWSRHFHHCIDRVSIRRTQPNSKLDHWKMDFGNVRACLANMHTVYN